MSAVVASGRAGAGRARPSGSALVRGVAIWAVAAIGLMANVAEAARVTFDSDFQVRSKRKLQSRMRAERARTRQLRGLLSDLPEVLLSNSLEHVPRGLQVAWASRLWSAAGPPMPLRYRGGCLREVRLFPGGSRFVAVSLDGVAVIGDAVSGRLLHTLLHKSAVVHVRIFPGGDRVLSWHMDPYHCLVIWDAKSGSYLRSITPGDTIVDVVLFPNGEALATSSRDARVTIWDAAKGTQRATVEIGGAGSTPGAGHLRIFPDSDKLLALGAEVGLAIVNATSGERIRTLLARGGTFSPMRLAAINAEGDIVATLNDEGVRTLCARTGILVRHRVRGILGGLWRVRGMEFFPTDNRIVLFGDAGAVVWDIRRGREGDIWLGTSRPVCAVVFSADGKLLATSSGMSAVIWDPNTGRAVRRLRIGSTPREQAEATCDIDIGPDLRAYAGWSSDIEQWSR